MFVQVGDTAINLALVAVIRLSRHEQTFHITFVGANGNVLHDCCIDVSDWVGLQDWLVEEHQWHVV